MSLDIHDPKAVRAWARDFAELLTDIRCVTDDMLARRRDRRLGHAIHAEKLKEGWDAVDASLANILSPDDGTSRH